MEKMKRSWMLLGRSLSVTWENKRLLLFPLVSFLVILPVAFFFLASPALWPSGHAYTDPAHWQTVADRFLAFSADSADKSNPSLKPITLAYLALVYLVSMFITIFLNVAFFHEILHALKGNGVSIGRGLAFAGSRWRAILMWSLLSGFVGLIIRAIEERLGFVGRWITALIGLAWSVASVFVIPVIIQEEESINPFYFLKSSTKILKKTWGESLIGFLGLQIGSLLIVLLSFLVLGITLAISIFSETYWISIVTIAVWLLALVAFAYAAGVAQKVYIGALYIYASEGVLAAHFDEDMMNLAWKVKGPRKAKQVN